MPNNNTPSRGPSPTVNAGLSWPRAPKSRVSARLRRLLATTVLIAAGPLATVPATAQDGGAETAGAVALDTIDVRGASGSQVGYVAKRTSTATKTDTPLRDVPQAVSVVTQEQIKDQGMQSIADVVRYVPGVNVAQGEGNRDALVIRGQATTADFFVDGVRDDVQYYRDLYNVSRVEALKGPNAMIFGRGGGGGVINRVIKEADWSKVREVTLQGGSFGNARGTVDIGQGITDTFAFRLNGMFERSDSYRDFAHLERYGFNPTFTFAPNAQTKIKLGYEYFHDDRTADRGVPSYRGAPFPTAPSTFFGNPWDSNTFANVHALTGSIEHETDFGLKIRNYTRLASYEKFYQNIFPGAVTADGSQVNLAAYNNATDRTNLFNQTDLTYTLDTGPVRHKLLFGTEIGVQRTDNFRNTGYFNNAATSFLVATANPITRVPVTFRQSASDADGRTLSNVMAAYVQDQIELTRQLQVIAGLRFDRFDLDYHNNRNGQDIGRTDNLLSPRLGVVFKPIEPLSLYASYSVSYLPSSGDQFGSLTVTQQVLEPEKFTNYEVGAKWDLLANLALTVAVYQLDRENTTAPDPNDPTRVVQTGSQRSRGFELGVTGNVTEAWQVAGGYAYQDARITADTTAASAGARVPLVPLHTFSLWNKYQFTPMWGAGVGLIHQTDIYAGIDNTVTLPGFTRVDAALFFKLNDYLRAQVNIENIFDVHYYPTAHSNNNIYPGSPRAVRVALTANW